MDSCRAGAVRIGLSCSPCTPTRMSCCRSAVQSKRLAALSTDSALGSMGPTVLKAAVHYQVLGRD